MTINSFDYYYNNNNNNENSVHLKWLNGIKSLSMLYVFFCIQFYLKWWGKILCKKIKWNKKINIIRNFEMVRSRRVELIYLENGARRKERKLEKEKYTYMFILNSKVQNIRNMGQNIMQKVNEDKNYSCQNRWAHF